MGEGGLPKKTKIAAWWIIVVGLLGTIVTIPVVGLQTWYSDWTEWSQIFLVVACIIFGIGLVYLLPGILFALNKRWAWTIAISILVMEIGGFSYFYAYGFVHDDPPPYPLTPVFLLYLVPLTLATLDVRKYWKMAYHRK